MFLMLVISCSKDDDGVEVFSKEPPEIPQDLLFDLNDDGIDDVSFKYFPDDVITDGTVGYYGYVNPLNGGSLLLLSKPNEGAYVLEIQEGDTIRKEESESFVWYPSSWGFIGIDDSPEGIWPNKWTLSSTKKSNPYYLGLQVKENDIFSLGWLKLEIDKKTGVIEIIDHELTNDNVLVIDR